jgi:hypothetical protein
VHVRFGGKLSETYFSNKTRRRGLILRLKQEALAYALGEEWSQKRVSLLEQREVIEDDILLQVSQILKVPVEAFKNFTEEAAINIISSTLHDNAGSINNNCTLTFNPIDKWLEVLEENKRLYERLLDSEREKVELLKQSKGL